jgi:hypothetical protein
MTSYVAAAEAQTVPQEDTPATSAETEAPRTQQHTPDRGSTNWLTTAPITSENVALNVIVGFIGVAQKRGAFSLEEAARLHQCVKMFQRGNRSS